MNHYFQKALRFLLSCLIIFLGMCLIHFYGLYHSLPPIWPVSAAHLSERSQNCFLISYDEDFFSAPRFTLLGEFLQLIGYHDRDVLGSHAILGSLSKHILSLLPPKAKRGVVGDSIREIFLMVKLERTLSREEIFDLYLSHLYFGKSVFGIEEASLHFFQKEVRDLSIAEACELAARSYSPKASQKSIEARQKWLVREVFKKTGLLENQ